MTRTAKESEGLKLAVEGGPAVRSKPFPPWPQFEPDDIAAVTDVLRSGKVNYWTGSEGQNFEREFAAYTGTKYAVAVANGTVALELALYALGVGAGDEVITPCRSFIATARCIAMRGATAVMVDIDHDSQTIKAEAIARAVTPRTKAVIAVHLAGWPCELDAILSVAADRNLAIIEDCAQAHGARYKGRHVGSIGQVGAFSFCQDKIMTTGGEGGMITTNDEDVWRRAWSYRDHGRSFEATYRRHHPPGYRWVYESFGTNARLTEMQSALGRRRLRRLDAEVDVRRCHAAKLNQSLANVPGLRVTMPSADARHAYYKYYVFVRTEALREEWNRDRILDALEAEGIPCYSGICSELYLEKAFEDIRPQYRYPIAKELGETSLMFQIHPTLSDADIRDMIIAIRKVMGHAAR